MAVGQSPPVVTDPTPSLASQLPQVSSDAGALTFKSIKPGLSLI